MKNDRILFALGMPLLAAGILMDRYAHGFGWTDFLTGFCLGLSLVLTTAVFVMTVRQPRKSR